MKPVAARSVLIALIGLIACSTLAPSFLLPDAAASDASASERPGKAPAACARDATEREAAPVFAALGRAVRCATVAAVSEREALLAARESARNAASACSAEEAPSPCAEGAEGAAPDEDTASRQAAESYGGPAAASRAIRPAPAEAERDGSASGAEGRRGAAESEGAEEPAPDAPRDAAGRREEPSEAGRADTGDAPRPDQRPQTLAIGGTVIPYVDVRGSTTPDAGAGLWLGSDAVDDGSWGYFVGHNPGSFAPVRRLTEGSSVVVRDSAGNERTYTVRTVFSVEETATWKTIASRVTGYGESVILQTCAGDGTNVIAVAA